MEVCGGQTHTIVKYGLDRILPRALELVHGPGCPVCVTSLEMIDAPTPSRRGPTSSSAPSATCCACPARAAICCSSNRRAATCASSIRRSMRSTWRRPIPNAKSSSSPSASRRRPRPTPWRSGMAANARPEEFQRAGLARAGAAGHDRHPGSARAIACKAFLGPGHVCTVMGYHGI